MFQLYRDGLEDLLMETKKKKKGQPVDEDAVGGGKLKITLAEHSPTGLVQVEGAVTMTAATPADVMRIFAAGDFHLGMFHGCMYLVLLGSRATAEPDKKWAKKNKLFSFFIDRILMRHSLLRYLSHPSSSIPCQSPSSIFPLSL